MLNVHHLELFYYVARHRGISEAARRIPYGIQQPAISGQISQLEAAIGNSLFQRRPFQLTPAGKRLYEFILPFFSNLETVEEEIRRVETTHLRLGASSTILAKHLPAVISGLREIFPNLHLTLKEIPSLLGPQSLLSGEIDAAMTVEPPRLAPGMKFLQVIKLPMVLIVPSASRHKSFKSLLHAPAGTGELKTVTEPLISLPEDEPLATLFQDALLERSIRWPVQVEVTSVDLGIHYAAAGFGTALSVDVPGIPAPAGTRTLPLPGFPQLSVGLLTIGDPKPIVYQFGKLCLRKVRELQGG